MNAVHGPFCTQSAVVPAAAAALAALLLGLQSMQQMQCKESEAHSIDVNAAIEKTGCRSEQDPYCQACSACSKHRKPSQTMSAAAPAAPRCLRHMQMRKQTACRSLLPGLQGMQ
jgi:hypothetical protein